MHGRLARQSRVTTNVGRRLWDGWSRRGRGIRNAGPGDDPRRGGGWRPGYHSRRGRRWRPGAHPRRRTERPLATLPTTAGCAGPPSGGPNSADPGRNSRHDVVRDRLRQPPPSLFSLAGLFRVDGAGFVWIRHPGIRLERDAGAGGPVRRDRRRDTTHSQVGRQPRNGRMRWHFGPGPVERGKLFRCQYSRRSR